MIEIAATGLGLLFGIIGTWISVRQHLSTVKKSYQERLDEEINRQAESQIKAYAAQRDFEHLRRHQEQIKEAIKMLQEDIDDQKAVLIELGILTKSAQSRIDQVAAKVDKATGG